MRIYLVGSHSVGKTTLCRYISETYKLPMIHETARAVLASLEVPIEKMFVDYDLVDHFQKEVIKKQVEAERTLQDDFVSDRAIDGLAYTAERSRVLAELMEKPEFKEYVEWVRKGTVFFVRPSKNLLAEDGVRETPTWESVIRIDGMVKLLLEQFKIDYLPINSPSMQERIRTVDFVINRIKRSV